MSVKVTLRVPDGRAAVRWRVTAPPPAASNA